MNAQSARISWQSIVGASPTKVKFSQQPCHRVMRLIS